MLYLIWLTVALWSPEYTKAMCDKTSWLHVFYFTLATLFAQVAITLRVYAVTGNNRWIRNSLSFITVVQFGFGMYGAVRFSLQPALKFPDLPFDEFNLCTFSRWRPGEILNTALSLAYDTLAFSIIIFSVERQHLALIPGAPNLLEKLVHDATLYFLVIFSSHLLLIFFEFFAPKPIQLLPAGGNAVLVPLMVTRLMLSLRRVANSPGSVWSLGNTVQPDSIRFANNTIGGTGRVGDNIHLKQFSSERKNLLPEP